MGASGNSDSTEFPDDLLTGTAANFATGARSGFLVPTPECWESLCQLYPCFGKEVAAQWKTKGVYYPMNNVQPDCCGSATLAPGDKVTFKVGIDKKETRSRLFAYDVRRLPDGSRSTGYAGSEMASTGSQGGESSTNVGTGSFVPGSTFLRWQDLQKILTQPAAVNGQASDLLRYTTTTLVAFIRIKLLRVRQCFVVIFIAVSRYVRLCMLCKLCMILAKGRHFLALPNVRPRWA